MRPGTVAMHLSKRLVERYFRDGDSDPPYHLVGKLQPITRRWIRDCLTLKGGTKIGMLTYAEIADKAADLIYAASSREAERGGEPISQGHARSLQSAGSTDHVAFITTKTCPMDRARQVPRQRGGARFRLGSRIRPRRREPPLDPRLSSTSYRLPPRSLNAAF